MPGKMTHWERVRSALTGDEVDRVPISLWRYFPVDDETPQGLADATLRWQRDYDFDLVKITPPGTYTLEDWGAQTTYAPNEIGGRTVVKHGVTRSDEWPRLKKLDVTRRYLGMQINAVRLIARELHNSVPILETVQSPLMVAQKLAGERVFADLRLYPELLKVGLQVIAETMADFAVESIKAGAHGIFFPTHGATYRLLNRNEYTEFGEPYDRIVVEAVRSSAQMIIMHAHGEDIMFDLVAGYPIDGLNWHDRLTEPTLKQGLLRFRGLLVGGISERQTLLKGPISAIQAEVRDAIAQTEGRRLMIGPGCVLGVNTPVEHIRAARQAVEAGTG